MARRTVGGAEALVKGDGGLEEGHSTGLAFDLHDLAEDPARRCRCRPFGFAQACMKVLPADVAVVAVASAVAG